MGEKKSYVKDYMTKNVICVSPDTETQKIIELMKEIIKVDNRSEIFSILKKEIDELKKIIQNTQKEIFYF